MDTVIKNRHVGNYHKLPYDTAAICSSQPFCVSRNRQKYMITTDINSHVAPTILREQAWCQTQYAQDRLLEHHIPAYLIHDLILDDLMDTKNIKNNEMSNCIVRCQHKNRSLYCHTAGRNLDDIVLRHAQYSQPHNFHLEPGFTIPLGKGSILRDLQVIGMSSWNANSHILARTESNIFHLKTTDFYDYDKAKGNNEDFSSQIILEPLEKIALPSNIVSMCSSLASYPSSAILTEGGLLYHWQPIKGIFALGQDSIFPVKYDSKSMKSARLFSTFHPQVHQIAVDDTVYLLDIRSKTKLHQLFRIDFGRIVSAITCSHYQDLQRNILLSYRSSEGHGITLIDMRHGGQALSKRYLPQAHEIMRSASYSLFHVDATTASFTNIVVGAAHDSRQIFLHSLSHDGGDLFIDSFGASFETNRLQMLLGVHSSGVKGCTRWSIGGYPVVDRNNSCLVGCDIIPCPQTVVDDFNDDSNHDNENNNNVDYNALLVQQSSLGDIYAQQLSIRSQRSIPESFQQRHVTDGVKSPIQLRLPVGNRCFSSRSNRLNYPKTVYEGITLEKSVCLLDLDQGFYPAKSTSLLPFVSEDQIHSFQVLHLDRRILRSDLPLKVRKKLSKATPRERWRKISHIADEVPTNTTINTDYNWILNEMMGKFMETLKYYPLTIYECWRYIQEVYHVAIDVTELLQFLRSKNELIEEYHLSLRSLGDSKTFDDLRVDDDHINTHLYYDRNIAAYDTPQNVNNDSLQCECIRQMLDNEKFNEISWNMNKRTSAYPCTSKQCILPHVIVFKSKAHGILSNLTEADRINSTKERVMFHQNKDVVTEDIIESLIDQWDEMIETLIV